MTIIYIKYHTKLSLLLLKLPDISYSQMWNFISKSDWPLENTINLSVGIPKYLGEREGVCASHELYYKMDTIL